MFVMLSCHDLVMGGRKKKEMENKKQTSIERHSRGGRIDARALKSDLQVDKVYALRDVARYGIE